MQDLKRQSNRRPAVRKLRLSSSSVRKNRSNPMPGLPVKLSKPNAEPGYVNSWIPPYFVEDDPAFLQMKIRWLRIPRRNGVGSCLTGRQQSVIQSRLYSQCLQMCCHGSTRPGCVGQQNNTCAALAETSNAISGVGLSADTVVHHTP
mgnify:CR=1 FL=1